MDEFLDDLAAFLMHRTGDPTCSPDGRLRIFALVGAYREGRDVEAYLRQEASAFAGHPEYRPAWSTADGVRDPRPPDGPGAATTAGAGTSDVGGGRSTPSTAASPSARDQGDRGRTCPSCGSMSLPGGHCECSYTDVDAQNRPIHRSAP